MTPSLSSALAPPGRSTALGSFPWRSVVGSCLSVGALAVALTIGWAAFGWRLHDRERQASAEADSVSRIWGGPVAQHHPLLSFRTANAPGADFAEGVLHRTAVRADLEASYRRRGLVEYPGYEVAFDGQWTFENPQEGPIDVAFRFPLPAGSGDLMLRDLLLRVDGQLEPARTEEGTGELVWRGPMEKGQKRLFQVEYRGRGLSRFVYELGRRGSDASRVVTAGIVPSFRMELTVKGARESVDLPVGSMSPTAMEEANGSQRLVWDLSRMLTSLDAGVAIPDPRRASQSLGHLLSHAPFFFVLFGLAVLHAMRNVRARVRALHLLGFAAAYFLYFPLAAYLMGYMQWSLAVGLATLSIAAMGISHAQRFMGTEVMKGVAGAELFFLAVPAAAYLLPSHTGLILVVAGLGALGLGLRVLGETAERWDRDDDHAERLAASAPRQAIPQPSMAQPVVPVPQVEPAFAVAP